MHRHLLTLFGTNPSICLFCAITFVVIDCWSHACMKMDIFKLFYPYSSRLRNEHAALLLFIFISSYLLFLLYAAIFQILHNLQNVTELIWFKIETITLSNCNIWRWLSMQKSPVIEIKSPYVQMRKLSSHFWEPVCDRESYKSLSASGKYCILLIPFSNSLNPMWGPIKYRASYRMQSVWHRYP